MNTIVLLTMTVEHPKLRVSEVMMSNVDLECMVLKMR